MNFSADLLRVWDARRAYGYISQDERESGYANAIAETQSRMHDVEWMKEQAAAYRSKVEALDLDADRARRIREQVRAARREEA